MSKTASKTWLVTGAAGFIGARFVERCQKEGIQVISVDCLPDFAHRPEHAGIDFGTKIDRDSLFSELARPDFSKNIGQIVHIGACSSTTEFDVDYLKRVNVDYSIDLWEFASKNRIPMVYASSAATYGDGSLGYDDDENLIEKLKPLNPYGESKRLVDLHVLQSEKKGFAPPAWSGFKFFNVYGFGERHKGKQSSVVLHAFDQIRSAGKVRLFKSHRAGIADGEQKRDFILVEDVIDALFFAIKKPIPRGIYNLGSGQARSFLDLVRATFQALGKPEKIEFIDTPLEIRDRYQYFTEATVTRIREAGYKTPFTSLEAGVQRYVERLISERE